MESILQDILDMHTELNGMGEQVLRMGTKLNRIFFKMEAVVRERDELRATLASMSVEGAKAEGQESLVTKLLPFFTSEATAKRFAEAIIGQSDTGITNLVNHYWQTGAINKKAKKTHLWRVLHNAGLYDAQVSNWNAIVDFR